MKKNLLSKNIFIGIIGNIYEHYDNTLFALIIPFISPIFFPKHNYLNALILTYVILNAGIITKPLGAIIFGYISDKKGPSKTLSITLLGSAITCLLFTITPSYSTIGILAPVLLGLIKASQSFFAAGEVSSGAIFVLDQTQKKSIVSSIYDASSIAGIFIASASVFLLSYFNLINSYWRILFFIGCFSAFIGFYFRYKTKKMEIRQKTENYKIMDIFKVLRENMSSFLAITCISGFSYSIYYFSIIFFNGYLPLVSNISKTQALKINTFLLIIDFCALPLFGILANKISKEKTMMTASLLITIISIPLFSLLKDSSILTASIVRVVFVLLGVLFSAPMHHLALELAPHKHRAKIIAVSYAVGSQMIGIPSCFIGLWLYKKTNIVSAPAIYLSAVAFISFIFIYKYSLSKKTGSKLAKINI